MEVTLSVPLQFPSIPKDVELLLAEHAAENDKKTALQLLYVCREFQKWVDPIVYRSVKLETNRKCEAFLRTLEESKSPSYASKHIKILTFSEGINSDLVTAILSRCTGVVSLAHWRRWREREAVVVLPCLRRLSFDIRRLVSVDRDPDFRLPTLQSLTHLDIVSLTKWRTWSWKGLSGLNNLTHLFVDFPHADLEHMMELAHSLAPSLPDRLKVCIIFVDDGLEAEGVFRKLEALVLGNVDYRLVLCSQALTEGSAYEGHIVVRDLEQILDDWGYPANGQADFWDQAEAIVRARHQ